MRKLLYILGGLTLTATAGASLVACGSDFSADETLHPEATEKDKLKLKLESIEAALDKVFPASFTDDETYADILDTALDAIEGLDGADEVDLNLSDKVDPSDLLSIGQKDVEFSIKFGDKVSDVYEADVVVTSHDQAIIDKIVAAIEQMTGIVFDDSQSYDDVLNFIKDYSTISAIEGSGDAISFITDSSSPLTISDKTNIILSVKVGSLSDKAVLPIKVVQNAADAAADKATVEQIAKAIEAISGLEFYDTDSASDVLDAIKGDASITAIDGAVDAIDLAASNSTLKTSDTSLALKVVIGSAEATATATISVEVNPDAVAAANKALADEIVAAIQGIGELQFDDTQSYSDVLAAIKGDASITAIDGGADAISLSGSDGTLTVSDTTVALMVTVGTIEVPVDANVSVSQTQEEIEAAEQASIDEIVIAIEQITGLTFDDSKSYSDVLDAIKGDATIVAIDGAADAISLSGSDNALIIGDTSVELKVTVGSKSATADVAITVEETPDQIQAAEQAKIDEIIAAIDKITGLEFDDSQTYSDVLEYIKNDANITAIDGAADAIDLAAADFTLKTDDTSVEFTITIGDTSDTTSVGITTTEVPEVIDVGQEIAAPVRTGNEVVDQMVERIVVQYSQFEITPSTTQQIILDKILGGEAIKNIIGAHTDYTYTIRVENGGALVKYGVNDVELVVEAATGGVNDELTQLPSFQVVYNNPLAPTSDNVALAIESMYNNRMLGVYQYASTGEASILRDILKDPTVIAAEGSGSFTISFDSEFTDGEAGTKTATFTVTNNSNPEDISTGTFTTVIVTA